MDAEWAAWLARPIAEREAIQDKVWATLTEHGVQAGRDMREALGMPAMPAELVEPAAVTEARNAQHDDGAWEPAGRVNH